MALLFSFPVAMDKFVIGSVVTAIRLSVDPVLDHTRCRHRIDDAASSFSVAVLSWQHSKTRGCTAPRECAIGRSYRFVETNASVSQVATTFSSEEAPVAPTDTKGVDRHHRPIDLTPRFWQNHN